MPKLLSLTIGWFLKFTEYVGFPSLEILKDEEFDSTIKLLIKNIY